ncbi:MAG TPA: ferredoxin [Actinobacteria bacterium]|nr:ferredoxin [Actinomycetota bacterium]HCP62264.1 ferredoxin [Actinomycetota bacterium]
MRVSIDQSLCRGDCICEQICPEVFVLDADGIAHVAEGTRLLEGPDGWVSVPAGQEPAVLDAAGECPTQAIFVRDEKGVL